LVLLVACQAGPHGPEQLEIVEVASAGDEALPLAYRVQARVRLGDPGGSGWELWLPVPEDGAWQRVGSLMIELGDGAQQHVDDGDEGVLHVSGRGDLRVSWRGWIELVPSVDGAAQALPPSVSSVAPHDDLALWVEALAAAGVEARAVHGLDITTDVPRTCRWVEVKAEAGWLPVDSATRRAGLAPGRIRLGATAPRAERGGEAVELAVRYELLPPS
jgi:hypothetical protein